MEQRIKECITGEASTEYILPFFWQHGEDQTILEEEIEAIYQIGIREFCVESRTHQQFGKEQWWEDFKFLLEEAKKFIWDKDFKGYIHDVGGPTANFRGPACDKQLSKGACPNKPPRSPRSCREAARRWAAVRSETYRKRTRACRSNGSFRARSVASRASKAECP